MEIVYFELNNWFRGRDYPDAQPFITWISDDLNIYFNNEDWVKENKLCIVCTMVDMSLNFCITTTKEWVDKNCPDLFTNYTQFLRKKDKDGCIYGQFGDEFLEYKKENIGIFYNWNEDEED